MTGIESIMDVPPAALPREQATTIAQQDHTGQTVRFAVIVNTPDAARRLRALLTLVDHLTPSTDQVFTHQDEHWLLTAAGHAGRLRAVPGGFDLDDGFGQVLHHLPTPHVQQAARRAAQVLGTRP